MDNQNFMYALKLGDFIQIQKLVNNHYPTVQIGDVQQITEINLEQGWIGTNTNNVYCIDSGEYIVLNDKEKCLLDLYNDKELLAELKRKLKGE